jgi:NitT/TauT family transport system ATP-binding protein
VLTSSPGRIRASIAIDLPRPRQRAELLLEPRFQTFVVEIERLMDTGIEGQA